MGEGQLGTPEIAVLLHAGRKLLYVSVTLDSIKIVRDKLGIQGSSICHYDQENDDEDVNDSVTSHRLRFEPEFF